jgi:DNA-binding NtrC family response regulator
LVVDDEVFVRELLEEYFGRLGYEVTTAQSGDAGLAALQAGRFGVALVDLKMPGKDGIETLREIRRLDPHCLIVIMTGYPTIDSSIEALRCGAFDYIIKPFKLGELREVVERAAKEYRLKMEIDGIQSRMKTVEGQLRQYRLGLHSQASESPALLSEGGADPYCQAQVRELDRLRDAGHLSHEEYEQQKQRLLSQ